MKQSYIAIHHTGGMGNNNLASSQHLNAVDINQAHRQKWNFPSEYVRASYGGYNFFIDAKGNLTQMRAIGEETAAQKGHNFNTTSICLAGNFMKGVDTPTQAQKDALKMLLITLYEGKPEVFKLKDIVLVPDVVLNYSVARIKPHRWFTQTDCNGDSLPDSFGSDFIVEYLESQHRLFNPLLALYLKLLEFVESRRPLAGDDREH